jgi:hypothetical protein
MRRKLTYFTRISPYDENDGCDWRKDETLSNGEAMPINERAKDTPSRKASWGAK